MNLSTFGEKFRQEPGIMRLMDDMGRAIVGRSDMYMLGGGNPAHIPAMKELWKTRLRAILEDPASFDWMLCNYDVPRGNPAFIEEVAAFLRRNFGWDVGPQNIAITNGAQHAFFGLLNTLAGRMPGGGRRKILLPLMPEYIGYADQGLEADFFTSTRPTIEFREGHLFKYRVDFERLKITPDLGAICASRPTNPTGNVLTDEEMRKLDELAHRHGVPLILDCAYGLPFPGIVFSDARPFWNRDAIIVLSLSKLGLPAVRTAIVIGPEEITSTIASMNSVLSLANGNIGQAIMLPLFKSDELIRISRDIIRPFYTKKRQQAIDWIAEFFDQSLDYHTHVSEGALFFWFWFRGLPITSQQLYERLKARSVLVVPGEHFFFGLDDDWAHRHECIRVNYSSQEDSVREGLRIIADEVKKAYAGK
ncbi:MAG: valine--pyruvate transaminase [Verrucomicrobia bacterium]|nr:valine--pyruvate transaminase [Verrucomicrobiota bacterium]